MFPESWEQFQTLLRKCPNHELEDTQQLNVFYHGLAPETRILLDVAAGGSMMSASYEKARMIITAMAPTGRASSSAQQNEVE